MNPTEFNDQGNSLLSSKGFTNKDDLLNVLNIIKNLNMNEEKCEVFDSEDEEFAEKTEPQFQEKISIRDVLNSHRNNYTDKFNNYITNTNEMRIVENASYMSHKNYLNNHEDQAIDEIYTFDPKYRQRLNDTQVSKISQFSKAPLDTESLAVADTPNTPNTPNMFICKTIHQFKQQMMDIIILVNGFSDNLLLELSNTNNITNLNSSSSSNFNNQNQNHQIVYEKCFSSLYKIKSNVQEIFNITERELSIIANITNPNNPNNPNNSNNTSNHNFKENPSFQENDNPFKNSQSQKINNSVYELAKTNYTNTNKSMTSSDFHNYHHNFHHNNNQNQNDILDKNDSDNEHATKDKHNLSLKESPIRKLYIEIFHKNDDNINTKSKSRSPNSKYDNSNSNSMPLNKTKDLIDKITLYYKERLEKVKKEKNEEIKKIKETIKNQELVIESSKNLIDEIYTKNRMLHERLMRYKIKYEN